LYLNVVAFHAANGMLHKNTDLTQGCIGSLLIIAQVRVWVLLTLARLLRWDINPITTVVRSNTKRASIDPNVDSCKPVQLRWELLFQHDVIVLVAAQRTPQKDDTLVRERHDRILQRMPFFFHWNAHVVSHHLLNDDRHVRSHQCGGDPHLATPLSHPPASPTLDTASVRDAPGYRTESARAYA